MCLNHILGQLHRAGAVQVDHIQFGVQVCFGEKPADTDACIDAGDVDCSSLATAPDPKIALRRPAWPSPPEISVTCTPCERNFLQRLAVALRMSKLPDRNHASRVLLPVKIRYRSTLLL